MEKRVKVADFAELVGCTPKTVYKMIERGELITGSERVNNRETTVIITSDKQIEDLQTQLGKLPVTNGECNENVTVNDGNEPVKNNNDNIKVNEVIDKVVELAKEYSNQLKTVNEELVTYKAQALLLEDKQKTEKEALEHWQNEYFQKKSELTELENTKNDEIFRLKKNKFTVIVWLISVIVLLIIGLITVSLLFTFEKQKSRHNEVLTPTVTVSEPQLPVKVTETKKQPSQLNKQPPKKK